MKVLGSGLLEAFGVLEVSELDEVCGLAPPAPTDAVESGGALATGAMLDALTRAAVGDASEIALPAPTDAAESGAALATGAMLDALNDPAFPR